MEFTNDELSILSDGIVVLIQEAGKAKELVSCPAVHKTIDNHVRVLQYLNTKICNYMEG